MIYNYSILRADKKIHLDDPLPHKKFWLQSPPLSNKHPTFLQGKSQQSLSDMRLKEFEFNVRTFMKETKVIN